MDGGASSTNSMIKDNDVIRSLIAALIEGLTESGIENPIVQQTAQIRQQGVPLQDAFFIDRVSAKRYGFTGRKQEYRSESDDFLATESRIIERVYQISTLAIEDVNNTEANTAFDLAEIAAAVIESQPFRDKIYIDGLQVYRITDIRTPYIVNDMDNHQLSPSFDFTITYCNELTHTINPAEVTGKTHKI